MSVALIISSQDRTSLAAALHSRGFEVLTAEDCESARRCLHSEPAAELVVVDMSLPDGNWCSVLDQLRDSSPDSKLLVCSERAENLLIVEVVQRGGEYALARSYGVEDIPGLLAAA